MEILHQIGLFLQTSIQTGTPILFAIVGGILCEKVGHMNLGVEGMMLMGASLGFTVACTTGNPLLAMLAAGAAGAAGALIYAFITVTLRGNQVVTGLVLTIFGTGIANLFGEDVVIFDVDGLEVARAGQNINTATDCGIVLALEEQKRPLGALEISQRNTVFDEAMCRRIEQIAAPVLTLYLDGGARVGMVAHLIAGPEDGVHVSPMEAREGHAMLDALGFAASGVYMPFAMKLKSVANAMPAIVSMIDDFESNGGCESICLLEGDLMIGFLAAKDSGGDVSVFSDRCLHALTQVAANEYVYTVHGRAALDTISLMDAFGALRSVIRTCISNDAECPYGTLECVDSSLLERMLGMERTDEAVRMVITQTVGHELMHNAMLIDTLCACFDNLDNKTGACEQLGIQRQTLYNRLDKVTQIVGIAPTDKISWSMLLLGAKMAKSQHNHTISSTSAL